MAILVILTEDYLAAEMRKTRTPQSASISSFPLAPVIQQFHFRPLIP